MDSQDHVDHRGHDEPAGSTMATWAPFEWVDTALGNIDTALPGTQHHVSAKRALASFAWRFDRRHQLDRPTERLPFARIHIEPHPYRVIVAG